MARDTISRYFPGRLLMNGRRVRMTRTIITAEITDSWNQPVRNNSGVARRMKIRAPNVR
jgi:hypothetical protein